MAELESSSPPGLDLRVVFFTIHGGRVLVALTAGEVGPRLPRGSASLAETLDGAARKIVQSATGVQEQYLEQLYTLSVRQPAPWTVVVSYVALVATDSGTQPDGPDGAADLWHDTGNLPSLSETDRMVVEYAVFRLRAKLGYTNIAFYLMPPTFTLTELQSAYETILARRLDKRNFRRRMIASGILEQTDAKRREGSHRPATLYRFHPESDGETYLTPPWADGA